MKRLLVLFLIIALTIVAWEWFTFPDVSTLAKEDPKTTAFMELRKKELRREAKDDTLQYRWVSYENISPYFRRAVLVSEDNAFYEHEGVDVEGMKEALRTDWKRKRFAYGGSTITQQLAKNLYLSPSRNPFRKIEEILIARSLEERLTKKRILELYMNVVELGERVYGVEAASHHYFDKAASSLNPREASLLAAALPNPRVMNPADPNKRLRRRQQIVLSRLRRWGYTVEREVLAEKKPQIESPSPEETATQTETVAPEVDTSVAEEPSTETTATTTEAPATETSTTATETTATAPTETTATSTQPPPEK